MGILGGIIVKSVAKSAAKGAAKIVGYGVVNHMEKTRSAEAIAEKSELSRLLFIRKKSFSIKRGFTVYDDCDKKIYTVKTDILSFGYPCVRLFDINGQEVGKVEQESKFGMGKYAMFFNDKKLGTISRKGAVKIKLDLDFNGWHLDGNFMQSHFVAVDQNGKTVVKFDDAFGRETYVLAVDHQGHEVIGLLLLMAVEIILHGNK